ncbi:MAG: quaternary ammonium compound efflux SMR transporter SugE [Verrucomicrobiota bacterium]|nr:quaternary ammonium compound efflux SMR transporter SugE [Verrucomicrobiota bacterium]
MSWVYLLLAGMLEIVWPVGMKMSNGFTRLWPTVLTLLSMTVAFYLMSLSLRTIPMGTAYAIWTGIGATGAAIIGIYFYGDSSSPARICCLALIVVGIVGLKLTDKPTAEVKVESKEIKKH